MTWRWIRRKRDPIGSVKKRVGLTDNWMNRNLYLKKGRRGGVFDSNISITLEILANGDKLLDDINSSIDLLILYGSNTVSSTLLKIYIYVYTRDRVAYFNLLNPFTEISICLFAHIHTVCLE